MKTNKLPYWVRLGIFIAPLYIFIFHPHLLGMGEDPKIIKIQGELLVDLNGEPNESAIELASKFGCDFWISQSKFIQKQIEMKEFSKEIFSDGIRENEALLAEHDSKKTILELESKERAGRAWSESEIVNNPKLLLASNLEKLKKEKVEAEEYLSNYKKVISKINNDIVELNTLLNTLKSKQASCLK